MQPRKRQNRPMEILFVQPNLDPPGGGNGVASWMLQHLSERGRVTVLSIFPPDFPKIDEFCGTSLSSIPIITLPYGTSFITNLRRLGPGFALVETHLLMRKAKTIGHRFDLICSANNEQDFGRPSIEYIHFPWNIQPRPDAPPGWNENWFLRTALGLYPRLCCLISGFREQPEYQNLTLVNSAWTGGLLKSQYPNRQPVVLHPPPLHEPPGQEPGPRQARFLAVGRLSPEKELPKLVSIVEGLRNLGHEVGLTLAGSRNHLEVLKQLRAVQQEKPWLEVVEGPSREHLQTLLLTHAYGIHGMAQEHYGMAIAELVQAGCLTMVCDDGGQTEIVTDPRLQYSDRAQAIEKWDIILRNPVLEKELRQEQLAQRPHLTKERFLREFATLVDRFLERSTQLSGS